MVERPLAWLKIMMAPDDLHALELLIEDLARQGYDPLDARLYDDGTASWRKSRRASAIS